MSDLTKEYFDQQIKKLATGADLLATKADLQEEIAQLAGMVERRFNEVERKLDVREEVERLKTQMTKVWDALNLG
ncbi:MAG: hypothetical protein Q8R55_06335 [Candidatus Taylorbacteria bacterium]|nr:hypothetical protein [Candidatus Taylorbacteria bacterium]